MDYPRFHLYGILKCGTEIEREKEVIEWLSGFIDRANKDLLKRGASRGNAEERGARIDRWHVEGNEIHLEISSDRFVRAHDAILRFRNSLSENLGRNFRIGIRGIEVRDFQIVTEWSSEDVPVPSMPREFVRSIEKKEGELVISLDNISEAGLRNRIPDRILNLLREKMERMAWKGKEEHWELIWESKRKEVFFDRDPTEEMVKRGWIKHASGRGQWIYGHQVTKIFRAFERILIENIQLLGYKEMIFPKLITWDVWKRSGHAKAIYPEIYYVCAPKSRDERYWEDVIDYFKITGEIPKDKIMERIENIGGMCYAQCPPFWLFVQGRTIANDCLPVRVFDRSGTSHRYESGGIHGIERVDEFHRIEILWLGTKEEVIEEGKKLQKVYRRIFDDILDLQWREAWVTPWFMAQEGKYGLSEVKEVGTIDYEAILPYNNTWLEFQNLSINGDKYPKGFNVKLQSGEELWSGCSGVGLERWTAAFLSQKGFDVENWPPKVRDYVGKLEDVLKFV